MSKEKMVTIPEKVYKRLLESESKLDALECYGVDNWSGYGDAMSSMDEEEDEDE